MVMFFVTHIRPILDYCSSVWNSGYVGDARLLESVQRRWTKQVDGLGVLDYATRLRSLNLFSVQGRLLRADLIKYWKMYFAVGGEADVGLFSLFERAPVVATRSHHCRLVLPHCSTDMKRRFFSVRCISMWNGLPAHVVECTSLVHFKRALSEHLGDILFEYC